MNGLFVERGETQGKQKINSHQHTWKHMDVHSSTRRHAQMHTRKKTDSATYAYKILQKRNRRRKKESSKKERETTGGPPRCPSFASLD
mmetsp:Transcript_28708/g.56237  ORF Transcript_28708/g.56237 Transcript_28708/m.56237 type:complete len:88 (-) Transcript_28708:2213-2476(-)